MPYARATSLERIPEAYFAAMAAWFSSLMFDFPLTTYSKVTESAAAANCG